MVFLPNLWAPTIRAYIFYLATSWCLILHNKPSEKQTIQQALKGDQYWLSWLPNNGKGQRAWDILNQRLRGRTPPLPGPLLVGSRVSLPTKSLSQVTIFCSMECLTCLSSSKHAPVTILCISVSHQYLFVGSKCFLKDPKLPIWHFSHRRTNFQHTSRDEFLKCHHSPFSPLIGHILAWTKTPLLAGHPLLLSAVVYLSAWECFSYSTI